MHLTCPKDPDHTRFDLSVVDRDVHVVDKDGEWTKTYDGDREEDWDHVVCSDCETPAVDLHSFEMQSLSEGAACPYCAVGTIVAGATDERTFTCSVSTCHFSVPIDPDLLHRFYIERVVKIENLVEEVKRLGYAIRDVLDYLDQ